MADNISFRNNKVDYLLSITVALQPTLAILQLFLSNAMGWDPEAASKLRMLAVAIPIVLSMCFVLKRNLKLTILVYSIVAIIVLATIILFKGRWPFMKSDLLKFSLPIVIPTGLCVASVRNLPILLRCMQYTSIGAAIIGMLYAFEFLSGNVQFDNYSMAFSYALMFPTCLLVAKKGLLWKGIALILMLEMFAVGSRGAFLVAIAFWLFSVIWGKFSFARIVSIVSFLGVIYFFVFDSIISILNSLFSSLGIKSRTLSLLLNDEIISHDSGRDILREQTYALINESPIWGHGVWADRQFLDIYCHNVFFEIFLDFGYVGGVFLMTVFCLKQYKIFRTLPYDHKYIYLLMLGLLTPLLASSSYLVSTNLGLFMGFSYMLHYFNKNQMYQDYKYL